MKKIIGLLLVLMVLSAPAALAQFRADDGPELGVRIGGELAQLRSNQRVFGNDSPDNNSKLSEINPGFTAGVFVGVPVAQNLFIQPELLYAQKGGMDDVAVTGSGSVDTRYNLDYIELPVLLRYDVQTNSRIVPSLYAGPYAAYAVRRNVTTEMPGGDTSSDYDHVVRRWDYGASAGVDFGYRLSRRTALIGVRYDLGLANILQDEFRSTTSTGDDNSLRMGGMSIMLGLRM